MPPTEETAGEGSFGNDNALVKLHGIGIPSNVRQEVQSCLLVALDGIWLGLQGALHQYSESH